MSTLIKMIKEIEASRAAFIENGKALLTAEFNKFFQENPGIGQFKWKQYSPYFNDGDECTFYVYHPTFTNDPDGEMEYEELESELEGAWMWGEDAYGDYDGKPTEQEVKAMTDLSELWGYTSMDDLFESLFGNHVQITVTANGISVDEYSHD